MREAMDNQKLAEQKLGEGKAKLAIESENNAIEDMKEALEQLKKERDRVAELKPEDLQGLADNQKETADGAGKLSEEMKKDNGTDKELDQQQDPLAEGQKKAQDAIDDANKKMDSASGQLAQGKPAQAGEQQKQAIEDLNRAKEEVDKQLEELREQEKMDALVQLEQMFSEMLEKQKEGSAQVLVLEEKRKEQNGKLKRGDRIELRSVEILERSLSEKSGEALSLLNDEGSSVAVSYTHLTLPTKA